MSEETPLQPITLEEELQRNPDLRETDVALLRDWVEKQPHLPKVEDRELVLFIHCCYYSVEAAKTTLDTYFTVRTHLPEFFAQRDPTLPEVQTAVGVIGIVTLPKPTQEGYKVIWARTVDADPSKYSHANMKKVFGMVLELLLYSEGTAKGHVIVLDMEDICFGHLTKLSVVIFKKYFFYLQEALPIRLKGLHFVNVVPFMDKILAMMKPFIKKELFEVMHIHTEGIDGLFKYVPQEILPMEYGGSAPPFLKIHEQTLPRLLANRPYFLSEEQRTVEESLRPGRARSASQLFGVEGTFKKLDID